MKSLAHVLIALAGIGIIKYAAATAITPPPACPTVIETTTACPKTCTFPTCAILSTLTAHCGCPDPAVTAHKTFSCTPGKCEPFPPPCATVYTVKRISDCVGPSSSSLPPSSQSSPISSSPSSSQPPTSSESTSSSLPPVSSSYPPESSSLCSSKTSSSESNPPLSETSTPPPLSSSTTPGPGPSPGSSSPPTPPSPTNPPSPGPVESHAQRRLRRPFFMFWL